MGPREIKIQSKFSACEVLLGNQKYHKEFLSSLSYSRFFSVHKRVEYSTTGGGFTEMEVIYFNLIPNYPLTSILETEFFQKRSEEEKLKLHV